MSAINVKKMIGLDKAEPIPFEVTEDMLVAVGNLCQWFYSCRAKLPDPANPGKTKPTNLFVRAVDDINMYIKRGEIFGLVGETGCGKTTLGKTILRLVEPTSGTIMFDGRDITHISDAEMNKLRLRMQLVFQDPYSSLTGRLSVGEALSEPLLEHKLVSSKAEAHDKVRELLNTVGLKPFHSHKYPHEFSGGQRQRIAIARALTVNPDFIVCDEPVSALDVSIQAQILNLLMDLRDELSLTYLFISHDLLAVRHVSDRIAVMYLGHIVELGDAKELYDTQLHPYTQALFSAIPVPRRGAKQNRIILPGDLPSPVIMPHGCPFAGRCLHKTDICEVEVPKLKEVAPGHFCACHLQNGAF